MNMDFHYSELCMPAEHLRPEYPQPFLVKKEAEYELRASVLVDGGDRFGVSSVIFDKYEELIWMGNQGGHVTSYYGPRLQKYTSFQIHATEEVRDILTMETGIFCLTKTSLRHQIRRGIPKTTYKSSNMMDMQCMFQLDANKVLMGGHQNMLLEMDLNVWKEDAINIPEEGCVVLRSGGGSVVACGSANGTVTLRDIRCPGNAEQTFRAHSACLSDLDLQGDTLITCGFTQSSGTPVAESYVNVWDARCITKSPVQSIPTVSPPQMLHFVPAVSGRVVAMASDGHVTVVDINDSHKSDSQSVFQVDTHSSQCSVMDISPTSQALVFGDLGGHINMFSAKQNLEPTYNSFSRATEFADPPPNLPYASYNDKNFRYTSVPRPPLTTGIKWFHEMPAEFYRRAYRRPKPIDPEVLANMQMKGPIGYAPNPGTFRRNEMPYFEDNVYDVLAVKPYEKWSDGVNKLIPRIYLRNNSDYGTPRTRGTFDIRNDYGLAALEVTLPNSYCNPMLQVYYYFRPLKVALLAHTCAREYCLSCELGFLFRTMDRSQGAPCQANNFQRAFRTVPEAAALGLILPDRATDNRSDIAALIQSWNRFMLQQIHTENLIMKSKDKEMTFTLPPPQNEIMNRNGRYSRYYQGMKYMGPPTCEDDSQEEKPAERTNNHDEGAVKTNHTPPENHEVPNASSQKNEESEVSELFAIVRQQVNRCTKCNKEEERESVVLACALQYVANTEGENGGFLELMRASLASRRSTPAWCEHCSKFTPTIQRGKILRLPPILAINCGGVTANEKAFWTKGVQNEMPDATKRAGSSKPCRYGLHCARPGCRFKHPERTSSSPECNSVKNTPQESSCVLLPHQLYIRLQPDGEVLITDKTDDSPAEPRIDFNKPKKKQSDIPDEEEYTLSSVIVCVEDSPKNLVAYIRIQENKDEHRWFLFNDLSIVPVSAEEVVEFSCWWKSPCVLFYTSARVKHAPNDDS